MVNSKLYEIVNNYIPSNYKKFFSECDESKIASFESEREDELRIMKVHCENTKKSGLIVLGLGELILSLEHFKDNYVFIINLKNNKYFLKLYLNTSLDQYLGCVLIKLRKKTEEEIQWGREVLGINSLPPNT